MACGTDHTLVVTQARLLFVFGEEDDPRRQKRQKFEVFPGRVGGVIVVYAAAGAEHSDAVTSGGAVWTWGSGSMGRLGHNGEQDEVVRCR